MIKMERYWFWIAWILWLIPMGVIVAMIVAHPLYRSMTPGYHNAVANWWVQQPVYTGPSGFNYLPIFLPFFSPFAWFPLTVGEILWRLAAFVGLGFGLWRCCSLMTAMNRYRAFALVSVLSLPICLSALRNGQSSAQLAACLVLAAWCLHQQRWWWATLWLCLALVCKPLGIPAIGLAVMAFPRLWWRATAGVLVVFVSPYFFAPANYVNDLYAAFASNLVDCFDISGRTFADLNGVLMVFDLKLSGMPSLIVRVTAGVAMAVGCWLARGLGTDIRRVLLWLGFTGIYIMLFTPMNEANSYVMLAPALGLWLHWHLEHREMPTAQIIAGILLTMALLPDLIGLGFGKFNGNEFAKFWYPLMTLVFLGILVWRMKSAHSDLLLNFGKAWHKVAPQ